MGALSGAFVMQKIILVGGGGHCKACIDVIEAQAVYEIAGIVDLPEKIGQNVLNYSVIGCDEDLKVLSTKCRNFFITVGQIKSPVIRVELFEKIQALGAAFPAIVSPRAYVSEHAQIGAGTIVMHNVVVNAGAKIGKNCIINTGAIIEHDATIEDNCHISTGAIINGGVVVKCNSFYGSGAVSKEYIVIESNSFVKALTIVKGSYA